MGQGVVTGCQVLCHAATHSELNIHRGENRLHCASTHTHALFPYQVCLSLNWVGRLWPGVVGELASLGRGRVETETGSLIARGILALLEFSRFLAFLPLLDELDYMTIFRRKVSRIHPTKSP